MRSRCVTHLLVLLILVIGWSLDGRIALGDPDPGHSHQGEAFDEGPRQFATLLDGTGHVDFDASGCSSEAQQFINQGVGQLHGFLNWEAERSFRHAAYLDDGCVWAYWGMAAASAVWIQNTERALKFIEQARERLDAGWTEGPTGGRSQKRLNLYVQSIEALTDEQNGAVLYVQTLRDIWETYPKDLDVKALFIMEVWRRGLYEEMGFYGGDYREKTMHLYQLAQEILQVNSSHPIHHYIVHMWDNPFDFDLALKSADVIGMSTPGIAHMWHMAGHTYSQGGMPFETWWSQEAAARVDHQYMSALPTFPYVLHNHAHNNEWLSRTLMGVGNFGKALKLSLNMLAQPRHPKLNHANQFQHLQHGANRTLELIERGGYWSLGRMLFNSPFLDCEQFSQNEETYQSCLRVAQVTELFSGEPVEVEGSLRPVYQTEINLVRQILEGRRPSEAFQELSSLKHLQEGWELFRLVQYGLLAKEHANTARLSRKLIKQDDRSVPFLLLASVAHAKDPGDGEDLTRDLRNKQARELFAAAQKLSQEVDLTSPFIQYVTSELRKVGIIQDEDWRQPFERWRDIHSFRPELSGLGPLLWEPKKFPNVSWVDKNGQQYDFESMAEGRPAVVVFLLNSCQHCDAQFLLLEEKRALLDELGVSLIAVTSQLENMPAFRQVAAFDDFESIPLHGLYIVNGAREIVWQDLSADAFMDIDFLMREVERALHPLQSKLMRGGD